MSFIKPFFEFIDIFVHTIYRDLIALLIATPALIRLLIAKWRNYTLEFYFLRLVKKHPNKIALISDDDRWTFYEIFEFSNQLCNYLNIFDYKPNDHCALFIPSKPLHPVIWFSLSRIGIPSALINENLRNEALIQAIKASKCSFIIFDDDLSQAIEQVYEQIKSENIRFFGYKINRKLNFNYIKLDREMASYPSKDLKTDFKGSHNDIVNFIYTSGTTGLPKAAILRQSKHLFYAHGQRFLCSLNDNDIIYNPLPLYHSFGSSLLLSSTFVYGLTNVIGKKFSASKFWDECIKYNCTVTGYIGEMTRYLLAQPEKPTDRTHKIKVMLGVGIRENVWQEFINRFGVSKIIEMFGSTEGNASLVNINGHIGACGFLPVLIPKWLLVNNPLPKLIKVDLDTGEPIRDKDGFCIECKVGESGMLIGKINDSIMGRFDGYLDKEGNKKKIINNVFDAGDSFFATYDVLQMDKYGYMYFIDRLGDTFRWKGENVSTNQVEAIMISALNTVHCAVYGVEIPGNEGKAGMAAVQSSNEIDFVSLYESLKQKLPRYAIPVFIRVAKSIEMTSTFKFQKINLKKEGFNINIIEDPIYFLDLKLNNYRKLDDKAYNDIINGNKKL